MPPNEADPGPGDAGTRGGIVRPAAFLLGAAAGMSLAVWPPALARALGDTPGVGVTLAFLAMVAFAFGVSGRIGGSGRLRPAGVRLAALGCLTLAIGALDLDLARLLPSLGAGLDANGLVVTFIRAIVGGLFVVPAALVAGAVLRDTARALPDGAVAGRAAALATVGATVGWLAIRAVDLLRPEAPLPPGPERAGAAVATAAITIALGFGVALLGRASAVPDRNDGSAPRSMGLAPAWSGFGVAAGLTGLAFVGERIFAAILGNELPGLTPALIALGLGAGAGAALAALVAPLLPGNPLPGWGAGLLSLGAAFAVLSLGNFQDLPWHFTHSLRESESIAEVLRSALALTLPRLAPAGFVLGAAATLVAGRLPGARSARGRWVAGVATGAAAGGAFGIAVPRLALPLVGFGNSLVIVGLLAVVPAVVAAVRGGLPGIVRVLIALVAPGLVAAAALRVPPMDRESLVVERYLRSNVSILPSAQQTWRTFDRDDPDGTWTVMRRGHLRRLYVNGRFERAASPTCGMLAHLPLVVHPAPERVAILGAGGAVAIRAALSHPVKRIDVLDVGRGAFGAAAEFGPAARKILDDERVTLHRGDPRELLARGGPYDVILGQLSGAWTERSARTSTREFLRIARARLDEDGVYCHWIPPSALTKEGFLVLLATFADVFPQVECWSGDGAAVLVLAKKRPAPHDFDRIIAAYRMPSIYADAERSWIGTPDTLLGHFLVSDEVVRRLTRDVPPHTRARPELLRAEAGRRLAGSVVDPVPGLSDLGDDVMKTLAAPSPGLAAAVDRARRARARQRTALGLEVEDNLGSAAKYREAIELNPRDGGIRRAYASLRSQMGVELQSEQALMAAHANLREAVESDTTFASGFANLGWLLARTEDYDYAISCTRQAIALEPDDDLFRLQLGRIWKQRGYYYKALPWYEQALEINPRNIEAAIGYIDCKLTLEDDDPDLQAGLDFLLPFRKFQPNHPDLAYRIEKLEEGLQRIAAGESLLSEDFTEGGERTADDSTSGHEGHDHAADDSTSGHEGHDHAADGVASESAAPQVDPPGAPAEEDWAAASD